MRLEGGGCLAGLAKKLVTVEPHGPVVLRVCPTRLPGPGTLWVEAVQPSGRLKPLFSMPLGTPGSRRLHLLRQPAATARHRSIFLGTWDAPCIAELRDRDFPTRTWCLPDFGRAPTSAGDREALERRFRRITALGLLPLEIPDLLPWYDEIFSIPNGLVVRRIRGEEARDLVVLDQGGPVRVLGSGLPPTTFVGEESVMTATQTMEGSRIEIYPVPWGRDEEDGSG